MAAWYQYSRFPCLLLTCLVQPGGKVAAADEDDEDDDDDEEDEDEAGDILLDELDELGDGAGTLAATMVPLAGSSHFLSPLASLNQ